MGKHKQKCPYNPENVPDCPSSPDNSPRINTVNQQKQDDHHLAAGAIALAEAMVISKATKQTARTLAAEGTAEATNGVTTEKMAK